MSHFLKSVLFGLAGGALGLLAIYLSEQFQNRRAGKHPLYDAEYVFSFPSNTNSNSQADPRPPRRSVTTSQSFLTSGQNRESLGFTKSFCSRPDAEMRRVSVPRHEMPKCRERLCLDSSAPKEVGGPGHGSTGNQRQRRLGWRSLGGAPGWRE